MMIHGYIDSIGSTLGEIGHLDSTKSVKRALDTLNRLHTKGVHID